MSGTADVMPQVKAKATANVSNVELFQLQGGEEYRGDEAASTEGGIETREDSPSESEEWEREPEEWERGEGSGESENSARVGDIHEEEDSTASEEEEGEGEEGDEEEGEGEEVTEDEEEATSMLPDTAGIRDISERERHTCIKGELSLRRVTQEEHHYPLSSDTTKPTTIPPSSMSSSNRQWLLELALVLLITTLLLTVCSRLGYEWLVRLCRIVPEKPI